MGMRSIGFKVALLALAFGILQVASVQACEPDSILTLLRTEVESHTTIRVDYHREVHSLLFGDQKPESGQLWIAQPNRYRIETAGQVYVRGNDTLWTYSEANKQVTIRTGDLNTAEFGPAGFFGSLSDDFIRVGCGTDQVDDHDCWKVRLAAKTETASIQRITLWVDMSSRLPRMAEYVDYNEETSKVNFSTYKTDQAKDNQQFTFAPPADADVVVLPAKKSQEKPE